MAESIGVVIPTYNRAHCVGDALESILEQETPVDRIVVVDDGSTDDTKAVLSHYGSKIEVIRQANAGVSTARNRGIAALDTEWVTFLDSDDLWLPNRMNVLRRDLPLATDAIVAHLANIDFTGPGYRWNLFDLKGATFSIGHAVKVNDALPLVIAGMSLECVAVRRSMFDAIGGFRPDIRMYEDTLFLCSLALQGQFLVTADITGEARRLDGDTEALTAQHDRVPENTERAYIAYLKDLPSVPMTSAQRQAISGAISSAEFLLAKRLVAHDPAKARALFLSAARSHPSPLRGWMKTALALSPAKNFFLSLVRETAKRQ